MAKNAPKAIDDGNRAWECAATRNAILDAARRVTVRDGVVQASLNRVAREAGFAPTTVYAYFMNRSDLVQSCIADDLTMFARTMRESFAFGDLTADDISPIEPNSLVSSAGSHSDAAPLTASNDDAVDEVAAEAETAPVAEAEVCRAESKPAETVAKRTEADVEGKPEDSTLVVAAAEADMGDEPEDPAPITAAAEAYIEDASEGSMSVVADAEAGIEDEPESLPPIVPAADFAADSDIGEAERDQPAISTDVVAELRERMARLESRPVDAWLERRLREFERGLAAIEGKLEKSAESHTPALSVAEQALRELRERLDLVEKHQHDTIEHMNRNIHQRIDVSEKRVRESVSDLHTAVAQSSRRLDGLENVAFAAAPQFFRGAEIVTTEAAVGEATETPAPAETNSGHDLRHSDDAESYLSAARRSANAAAMNNSETENENSGTRWLRNRRTLYLSGGFVVLMLGLFAAGTFFRSHAVQSEPARIALSRTHANHARRTAVRIALDTEAANKEAMKSRILSLADAGNTKAELLLALEDLDANGGSPNATLAAQWLERAASRGDAVAQYRLGALYHDGQGVSADPVQALHWFRSAALQGNRKAMHSLAVAYAEGWGVPKDMAESAHWFARAAALGFVNSQFNLGVLYERGLGVPQSLLDAYKWYAVAASQGDAESAARVEALKSELDADDLAAAQRSAELFKPDPMIHDANFAPQLSDFADG